ncbi:MAG: IS1182 family transposase [Firmicutes bacterium]|nr:IS1182 family transposase [Bacillota bacterium]
MKKTFRPYNQSQLFLLPPSIEEWVPENHLARFVNDTVDQMDLSPILAVYERESRGYPPYHPAMLLKILIYGYATGVYSSRKLARACEDVVIFRYLSANQFPDFRTINTFRKRHLESFQKLFVQVLQLCMKADLVQFGAMALDGTKIQANASKHKAMSYERMKEEEKRLLDMVRSVTGEAQSVDEQEDRELGDRRGDELPEALQTAQGRLAAIREAKAALEQEAKERAEEQRRVQEEKEKARAAEPAKRRGGRKPKEVQEDPSAKMQRNFTDPESRIMKTSNGFIQGYNVQAVVDEAYQVIVATRVSNKGTDMGQIPEMVRLVMKNTGRKMKQLLADKGYAKTSDMQWLEESVRVDGYIAVSREKHHAQSVKAPRGRMPKNLNAWQRMKRKLQTKRGRRMYAKRKMIVEPVFGQIKECRGFRRFSLRGQDKVSGEWDLIAMCHNLLKLYRYGKPAMLK